MPDIFGRSDSVLSANHLLAGGFVLTVLATFWSRIKLFSQVLLSRLIVTVNAEDMTGLAMMAYCWKHFKRSQFGGRRRFGSFNFFIRPVSRHQDVAYEGIGKEPIFFWKGWRMIILRFDLPKAGEHSLGSIPLQITFIRGMFDVDKLIIDALDEMNVVRHEGMSQGNGRFRVERVSGFRLRRTGRSMEGSTPGQPVEAAKNGLELRPDCRILKWQIDEIGVPKNDKDPFAALALTPEVQGVVEAGRRWLKSEAWYKEKRIPWRMGWLLYGQPGTGKSSLVRAIGQAFDLPVFTFDLSTFDNSDLDSQWKQMLTNAPCIALLEDIDNVFHGRENVTDGEEGNGVTFDCLLNCISGVGDASGVLTIVTTNQVDKLDEALGKPDKDRGGFSTRPGRIDRAVEMPALSAAGRRYVAERILADCPDKIDEIVRLGEGDSGAQFEDRCARIALDHYWAAKVEAA